MIYPAVAQAGSLRYSGRLSACTPETVEVSVLGADNYFSGADRRGCRQRRARFVFPELGARGQVEHVEAAIVRADVDSPSGNGGRRVYSGACGERPDRLAVCGVDAVDQLVTSAQHHLAIDD